MKKDPLIFIEHILENIDDIEGSVKNLSKTEFENNKDVKDATVRRIEVIGEAVKNIPETIKKKYPDVPWRDVAGFRDVRPSRFKEENTKNQRGAGE